MSLPKGFGSFSWADKNVFARKLSETFPTDQLIPDGNRPMIFTQR
jgi:hypothetical protein